jgi:hypothetical protein
MTKLLFDEKRYRFTLDYDWMTKGIQNRRREHLKTRLSVLEPGCARTLATWDLSDSRRHLFQLPRPKLHRQKWDSYWQMCLCRTVGRAFVAAMWSVSLVHAYNKMELNERTGLKLLNFFTRTLLYCNNNNNNNNLLYYSAKTMVKHFLSTLYRIKQEDKL